MMNTKTDTRRALRGGKRTWPSAFVIHHPAFIILTAALLSGCGGKHESSVSGTVTLNGVPLTTGTVTFHPANGGPVAYGLIKPDGTYTLVTGSQHGLPSGEYVVTVVATAPPEPPSKEHMEPVGKLLTPVSYGSVKTSPLRVTVNPSSNRIPLELK